MKKSPQKKLKLLQMPQPQPLVAFEQLNAYSH